MPCPNEKGAVTMSVRMPSDRLRRFVRRFISVEFHRDLEDFHLPETGSVAAIRLRGECFLDGGDPAPRAAFTGIRSGIRTHRHSAGSAIEIVAFTPLGASLLVPGSQAEFTDKTTDLAQVIRLDGLVDRLADEKEQDARVSLLEARLGERELDPVVEAAVARIERASAKLTMGDLARYVGLSQSALERRFQRAVGTSPKQFAGLVRLQRVLRLQSQGLSLSRVTHEAGYFDQAHFTKDFRRYSGQAPEAYFARGTFM